VFTSLFQDNHITEKVILYLLRLLSWESMLLPDTNIFKMQLRHSKTKVWAKIARFQKYVWKGRIFFILMLISSIQAHQVQTIKLSSGASSIRNMH